MSSSIHTLLEAVTDGQRSLTQFLRQTQFIAARLNLEDVEHWVDLELQGYSEDTEPPSYRRVFTHILEIYNTERDEWQFAGNLNYALKARQPIEEIEKLSRVDRTEFSISKNFSVKNNFGDSFGSDWPQRFVVAGSQYRLVEEAVMDRWMAELERCGIKLFDVERFIATLDCITEHVSH